MPEHEPPDVSERDQPSGERHEMRASRATAVGPRGGDTRSSGTADANAPVPSDAAEVASEPMILERLPDGTATPPPPGRQRTGDPPAV